METSQQIKKKDYQQDNQSADKDLLTNPMLDVVSRIDGGQLCSNCPELIKRYGYCQVVEDWVEPQLNVFSWDWRSNK